MINKNITKLLIKLAFSATIIAVLLSRMDMGSITQTIHQFSPTAWALSATMVIVQFALVTYRWMVLINIGHTRMTYRQSLEVSVASLVANALFITAITGVVVRIAMSLHHGASLFKSFVGTAVDRLMTLAALLFLSGLFLPFLGQYIGGEIYVQTCLYLGIFIFLTFVFAPIALLFLLRFLPLLPFAERHIRAGARYLKILLGSRKILSHVTISSLIAQICFFISVYIIVLSTDASITLLDLMTVLPLITLIASLPISFGGWGVREGAFVYGLGVLGVAPESAFLISVQTGLIGLFVTLTIGTIILLTSKTDFSNLPKVPNIKKAIFSK